MTEQKPRWYEKEGLVVLWLILFFPVGLYGLWKITSSHFSEKTKWIVIVTGCIVVLWVIGVVNDHKNAEIEEREQIMLKQQQIMLKHLAKDFAENQEKILSNAKQLLEQEKYSQLVAISEKYAFAKNQQLEQLGQKARDVLQERAQEKARMEQAKKDMEKDIPIAQSRCKRAAVDSAKYEGAESDFSDKSEVFFVDIGTLRVVGNDVKMKNAFNASRYVEYTGIYKVKEGTCTIISVR